MKKIALCMILGLISVTSVSAQGDSFQTLREKFSGNQDVFCFGTNGFLARAVLWMAGEHDFNDAIKEIHGIRMITIPESAFREQGVSLAGFKRVLARDSFDELVRMNDHGDAVTVYLQSSKKDNNRYMVLIEEPGAVIAIEFQGHIDPNLLLKHEEISYRNR